MSTAAIIAPTDNAIFGDLAKALTMSFMELGWSAMWIGDKDQIREYAHEIDLALVLTPFDYETDIHRLLPRATRVLYQLEQLPWPEKIHFKRRKYWKWEERFEAMRLYDAIFEYDMGNIKEHYRYYNPKRPVFHLPIGYSFIFELEKRVRERNIALFIGSDCDHPRYTHRSRTLKNLKSRLKNRFATTSSRFADKAKQAAKNSAVNLNIHQNNIPCFESLRIMMLIANQCFIITEPILYMEPLEHLKHLAVCSHKDMAAEIRYYLETPWERKRMAKNAYRFVTKHYTMTKNLKKVLKEL